MVWQPAENRYASMKYNHCGKTGLKLPAISLGLWHNFGNDTPHQTKQAICRRAFDLGITHFDLANNYGPPPGSAETAFGEILKTDFRGYRDEMIISSKAGYNMNRKKKSGPISTRRMRFRPAPSPCPGAVCGGN